MYVDILSFLDTQNLQLVCLSKHYYFQLQAHFDKTNSFAEYQSQLETLQHGWYVCIQVALIKKSILIISYHDVKMVSWIRLNDSVTTAFF